MKNLLEKETLIQIFPDEDHNKLHSILDIYNELGVNRDFFNVDENDDIAIKTEEFIEKFYINRFIDIANKLNKLKSFDNFKTFSEGFNNPTQISSTLFEIDCADFVLRNFKVDNISFAPEVPVKSHIKKPDFVINFFDATKAICECKSMYSINRTKQSRILKLLPLLEKPLNCILDPNYRVEIAFQILPTHWNRNYATQLAAAIKVLIDKKVTNKPIELNFDSKQKTWIKLSKIEEDMHFNFVLNVGNKPKDEMPTLVISEYPNLKKDIKSVIRDARTQLPEDRNSIIFIYSLSEVYAKQAIKEFIEDNDSKNLLSVISWTQEVKIHRNLKCSTNIQDYMHSSHSKSRIG